MFQVRRIAAAAVNLVWPPRSLLSDAIVDRPGVIEAPLWSEIEAIVAPVCVLCGFPLPDESGGESALCGACAVRTPAYTSARAAFAYDDHARKLVLDMKRGGRRDGLGFCARRMSEAGADALSCADFIAPAPMHWLRIAERGFNQAAWLALAIGHQSGKPVKLSALSRVKKRRSQEGLSASERRRNVQGAYRARRRFEGKSIVLVDDVFTTGATLEACARALKKAGAARVDALTLARVVRARDATI